MNRLTDLHVIFKNSHSEQEFLFKRYSAIAETSLKITKLEAFINVDILFLN